MNVSAGKFLLCVSIAGYTFVSWDHLFAPEKPVASTASKSKDLSAGMVNRSIVLSLGGDPFDSVKFRRDVAEKTQKPGLPTATGILDDGTDKPLPQLSLQGILITPTGPVALVSGRPIEEGEIVKLEEGKARIRARRIGEDFAVIEGAAQLVVLKLESKSGGNGGGNESAKANVAASEDAGAIARRAARYPARMSSARD